MDLNGALSNPLTSDKRLKMARLSTLWSDISIDGRMLDRPTGRFPRRQGSVLAAVTRILRNAPGPLRVRDIHASVEELVGEPVPYSTVKDALSAHSGRGDYRFRRTRHGCYELS
jgi:hypothetical protein